jgi:hypothetical protein
LLEPRKIQTPGQRILYVFDEAKAFKASSAAQVELLRAHGVGAYDTVICDSAMPHGVADYQELGILGAVGADKAGRDYSFKWLQTLDAIIIDPEKCPNTLGEFQQYEYERTRSGEIISGFPKKKATVTNTVDKA